jgi:hypothetical protein
MNAPRKKSSQAAFLLGTFAPLLRASERPIAIACLRLFTLPPFPPLPDLSVPRFLRRIALATVLLAALPYFRPRDFVLIAMDSSSLLRVRIRHGGCAVRWVGCARIFQS